MCDYDTPDLLLLPPPLDYPSPLVGGILVAPPLWPQAPPPPFPDQFAEHAFDSLRLALAILKSEVTNNNNIASPSSPPCLERAIAIQRTTSSHSPYEDVNHPLPSSCQGESMRIGASQQLINSLQNSHICSNEGVRKVGRYSVEERRERIKRYRNKRNQRNFHKKIKYECRKTLADNRPRIRGRFAKNEDMGEYSQRWSQTAGGYNEDDDDAWINFLDALPMNLIP
ncbi:two-component response regulator-like protein APRR1 isoform X1 [Cinnamomum micranthum f. kanehirae]|uniref:Two-component response regulator-like protein APRR1 isoform X1 n=1 Tax=Cinnamomum micranthum f. kanehirae TaxID=337451 RepID=A0A443PXM4_9MAGN|nr:two-component response regulator-like protein APRR1 isoform X1 [Cinnamomum micranthum f. kanehirae]